MSDKKKYSLNDFYFKLSEDLIPQYPSNNREDSRLFVLHRDSGLYEHRVFHEIGDYLKEGDLLVVNNAKVIPARVFFKRNTGGQVEILLTNKLDNNRWIILSNKTKRLNINEVLTSSFDSSINIKILKRIHDYFEIEANCELTEDILKHIGEVPLPPYIKRDFESFDQERYQTVYASEQGAVAAPTAGLHFSKDLIDKLKSAGIIFVNLTLYVSWGTFQPVREQNIENHKMHKESFFFPESSATVINNARSEGRRIISVGTTTLRVLESTFRNEENSFGHGDTDLFIYPPNSVKSINALITNFHTPYSTLLMLVSSFAGYERIMDAYKTAVDKRYRFFSYGDSMLIL
ncbi:MAG: tRNA preQ1(34) S-adenosylmethionine ribosyltransferase-isomerase QueA [Spirochaetota bacterium]|nr:tRNA preQ1(34) S-adenosylmethionine ribosyltransferase-isomerase QueA [Spirochaetota bacterium]